MKNSMKLATFLAAGTMILTGCGGGTPAKVTVQFWHAMGKTNQEILNNIIARFNKKHPEIAVQHTQQGGYDNLYDKICSAIPANNAPTMASCYPDHVADYLKSGAVIGLDEYFDSTAEYDGEVLGFSPEDGSHQVGGETLYGEDDYVEAFWEEGKTYAQEGTYSVPQAKSTEVMFYNKTFFEANSLPVPTKWVNEEDPNDLTAFVNLSRKIREIVVGKGGIWGGEDGIRALGYDSDDNLFITFSAQLGIPYTSADPDEHYPFGNSAESKAMVATVKSWYDDGFITTGDVEGGSYTSTIFTEQKLYMAIGSTGGTRYNNSTEFDVGVAKIPQWGTEAKTITQGPSVCFFKQATEEQKQAAWLFYRTLTDEYDTLVYGLQTGYEPVRISSYEDNLYATHVSGVDPFTEEPYGARSEGLLYSKVAALTQTMTNDYFNTPTFRGSATARKEVGGIITSVLLGNKTIDGAFLDAYTACHFVD